MYVNVKCNTLKTKTNDVANNHLEDIESSIKNIEKTVTEMGIVWKGNDYDNFHSNMKNAIEDLRKLQKSITTYNDFIKGYNLTLEKLDFQYKYKKIDIK